jgi:arylsulfatase A-like enzyme
VMFLSDNGGCTEEPGGRDDTKQPGIVSTYTAVGPAWGAAQNTPFRRYKSWANEGGISTPLIVRWPGHVKAGTMTNQMGHIIDVLPTCLELAGSKPLAEIGGKKTQPLEGQSLGPILRGEQRVAPARLFWEWSGNCAVREGQWKVVWDTFNAAKKWQLYDVVADRTETTDLAEKFPDRVSELSRAYDVWAKALGRHRPGQKGKNAED